MLDRGGIREHVTPPTNIFGGNYSAKFGHLVNYSYIYFRAKMYIRFIDYSTFWTQLYLTV